SDTRFPIRANPSAMFNGDTPNPHAVSVDGVVGGSPLNMALGLARMGNRVSLFTRISDDAFGQRLRSFMAHHGINDSYCVATDQPTTLAMVETDENGHPTYSIYSSGTADCSMEMSDIPVSLDARDRLIHLGSFATVLDPSGETLRAFAKQNADTHFITYDPNVRMVVVPDIDQWRDKTEELLPIAGMVKASDEDLGLIYPDKPLEWFIEKSLTAGADMCIVTKGPDGALIGSADGRLVPIPGVKVDVVDTVGAGDTFMAASMHYLAVHGACEKGKARDVDLIEMGRFAVTAAAITCTRRGADLPSLADIDAFGG
ncbi:MAG: carbohydrate kinase, partial [Pseudomonadota bacterium]